MQIARRARQSLATRLAPALAFAVDLGALSSRPAHTPLRDLADTVVAYSLVQIAAYATDRFGGLKDPPRRN